MPIRSSSASNPSLAKVSRTQCSSKAGICLDSSSVQWIYLDVPRKASTGVAVNIMAITNPIFIASSPTVRHPLFPLPSSDRLRRPQQSSRDALSLRHEQSRRSSEYRNPFSKFISAQYTPAALLMARSATSATSTRRPPSDHRPRGSASSAVGPQNPGQRASPMRFPAPGALSLSRATAPLPGQAAVPRPG
jgi:hypothetical protein